MSAPLSGLRPDAVIKALSGIAYLADEAGVILAFSRDARHAPTWGLVTPDPEESYIGRSLFAMIRAGEVREACRSMHQAIWQKKLPIWGFEHRCDEPEMKRTMRLSMSLVAEGARPVAVLYQSHLLRETPRPAMGLFQAGALVDQDEAHANDDLVTVCSYCHAVAWPLDLPSPEWIEPADYYRRGGRDDVAVSHGICPDCYAGVVEPPLRALQRRAPEA